jgi:hypothetical protein
MTKGAIQQPKQAAKATRLSSIAAATILVFATFGCSAADDENKGEYLSASEVCDSSLDATAAAALKRAGGTKEFTELSGRNDDGQPNKFSLKRSAATLYKTFSLQNHCVVFKAGDDSGHPLISIELAARESSPEQYRGEPDDTFYPMGTYTKTSNDTYALLYFKCSTKDPEGEKGSMPYIRAALSSAGRISASSTGHDLMTILNAVSRAMAKTLGCESEAALPSRVPPARAR